MADAWARVLTEGISLGHEGGVGTKRTGQSVQGPAAERVYALPPRPRKGPHTLSHGRIMPRKHTLNGVGMVTAPPTRCTGLRLPSVGDYWLRSVALLHTCMCFVLHYRFRTGFNIFGKGSFCRLLF